MTVEYDYRDITANESIQYLRPGTTTALMPGITYSYDTRGNISRVEVADRDAVEYTYDAQNQLTKESEGSLSSTYTYDTYGNIRGIRTEYQTMGMEKSYAFTYNDSGDWKDLLTGVSFTGYNGKTVSGSITYDEIGNPLTYFNGHKNWSFTWKYGRQLASASDGTSTITNTYDVDGIRQTKAVNGVEHNYVTLDGKIVRETYGTVTVDYFYDNGGNPFKIEVDDNGTKYTGYYVLNQQGDVIGILDADGNVLVKYFYNAWGLEVDEALTERSVDHPLKQYNALKYRGYYYDADLELYYLNSRYYNPVICRFINADDVGVMAI